MIENLFLLCHWAANVFNVEDLQISCFHLYFLLVSFCMIAELVSYCRVGKICKIFIERPSHKNAVDRNTASELLAAFRKFEDDSEAHVCVLGGAGGTFCAGADLKSIAVGQPNRLEAVGAGPMGPSRLFVDKPIIAAVQGHAVAGGLELALWADLRVAEESSVLGVFCRNVGVPLIDGGTIRLVQAIGLSRALDLILTGRAVAAKEAHQMGLVNRVVPDGEGVNAAMSLAKTLSEFPQAALRADRRSAHHFAYMSMQSALIAEFTNGLPSLSEGVVGARNFSSRHPKL